MTRLFDVINEENFVLFAMNHYENPQCQNIEEFYEDLHRFKYVKRLLGRYMKSKDDLQERLILNHITIIYNVFGIDAAHKMMKFKFQDEQNWPVIKPFLILLSFLDDNDMVEIPLDKHVVSQLRDV